MAHFSYSHQKYATFQNQFFCTAIYIRNCMGNPKKTVKKLYEQYLLNQHGPEPALVEN
jgi:hypothetical protein